MKRGFTKAAKAFQRESFTEPVKYGPEDEDKPIPVDLAELEPKSKVNQAVQDGEILKAIEVVNQLDPKILRDRPALNFKLHRERLLESWYLQTKSRRRSTSPRTSSCRSETGTLSSFTRWRK